VWENESAYGLITTTFSNAYNLERLTKISSAYVCHATHNIIHSYMYSTPHTSTVLHSTAAAAPCFRVRFGAISYASRFQGPLKG
jgi:hypothetical protein